MRKWLLALLVVISIIAVGVYLNQPEAKTPQKAPETVIQPKPTVQELFTLVNKERAKAGVKPLVLDERLNQSAQLKADDMTTNNYFAHINPTTGFNGPDYMRQTAPGVCYAMSENNTQNIYVNTSAQAVKAWVNSPPHYEAMLRDRYTLTGFGISGVNIVEHFCQLK